ncbi:phospho-N-acetylmuramoyl-pentapeptide-transferase [Parvicella tangerina]|uniref:Phospho-N-acetylmuramoyl-pentapeptide-transferase n=1 Tax=Parvicella tangerina TaxID=2829795 RepID=A0A916JQA5_9FLAO|nr:phospho-N-acetylmuramoyl-pentapeptide-transferase [Parvicella tangerina]CAG5085702.1 Phospho-N-acetylmuramoyl-pentapeptide-transferase [Parvicella tangerina]
MLYHLFEYLQEQNVPGAGLFQYISFRAGMAIIVSLLISMVMGGRLIRLLQRLQVGESIRDLGLEGQNEKAGTPTMGGLIILGSILVPTLLFAKLDNIYTITMLIATVWLGMIGFLDDYIKVFKKNKKGLAGKFKVVGQVGVGIIVGSLLYFHDDVVVKEKEYVVKEGVGQKGWTIYPPLSALEDGSGNELPMILQEGDLPSAPVIIDGEEIADEVDNGYVLEFMNSNGMLELMIEGKTEIDGVTFYKDDEGIYKYNEHKSHKTTIPFIKNNEFDYEWFGLGDLTWLIFIPLVIIIVTAVSNGANLTDGLDGLATGTSAIIGTTLAIFAYLSGNAIFADYLNIMYIPDAGELVIYISSFIGATIGFLWYNSYPAKVFMGDTGSLALGGIIATFAIAIRKELLIPVICGVFLIENVSVMMQVAYFKYTKKKTGEGKRVFLMAPLHHHYQKKGMHEAKIVARFWIVGIILAVLSIVTLKLR